MASHFALTLIQVEVIKSKGVTAKNSKLKSYSGAYPANPGLGADFPLSKDL
jgi:hypothetical protein